MKRSSQVPDNAKIESFRGRYAFLSNFAPAPVTYEGVEYPTVEHAYQAAKTIIPKERETVRTARTAAIAKKIGRTVHLRSNWEDIKLSVMMDLIRQKFAHESFRSKLLATGDAKLIEGNWWDDRFWGVCNGRGDNYLGRILMIVRTELRIRSFIKDKTMKRMLRWIGMIVIACLCASGLLVAQTGATWPPYAPRYRLTIHLFSPWLGEQTIERVVLSETDAILEMERLFRQGYWQPELELEPGIVWPPSSIVWINTKQIL